MKASYGLGGAEASLTEVLVILLVVGVVLFLAWSWISGQFNNALSYFKIPLNPQANKAAAENAVNRPAGSFQQYENSLPVIVQPVVDAGLAITPTSVITQATTQGAAFSADLAANGATAAYNALTPPLKGLVTAGEAISRTFTGFSPFDAGVATMKWITGQG